MIISHLLNERDHPLSSNDSWELNMLAAELDKCTDDDRKAILAAWEDRDRTKCQVQDICTGSSAFAGKVLESEKSKDFPELEVPDLELEELEDPQKYVRQVRFGDVQEIVCAPASESSETSSDSTKSQITWKYTGENFWKVGVPVDTLMTEYTSRRTWVCDNCGHFYLDPDSHLIPEIEEEPGFHGFCSPCLARVDGTTSKSIVIENSSDDESATDEDEEPDYPQDRSLSDENAQYEVSKVITHFNSIHPYLLISIPYYSIGLPKTLPPYFCDLPASTFRRDARLAHWQNQRAILWRPASESELPMVSLTDPHGEAEMLWIEGDTLSAEKSGRTLREELDHDWLLHEV